ncbi:MAG: carbon-monoxide dehydrogenase catalytic subunit [Syntrophobacterales bacterium CG03_land_8_20_14_0_80_58_14]|nr:MAG: carbon-monoxide dehydrogenase catalytic subunit [Syntrophobacterales bacterium CG03_land_8_20_14_0_80_58_14]
MMSDLEKKSIDPATIKMIQKAAVDGCETIFDRAEAMKPCPIGAEGSCCKNCAMGPCRVPAPKKKEGPAKKRMGLCGATAETISARNFARMVAAGTAAHSDHARGIAKTFLAAAKGEMPEFKIKDEQKLYQIAMDLDVEIGEKSVQEIAIEVGKKVLEEFGRQDGEVSFIKRAPLKRQEIWRKLGVAPRGIDREVVELMHRTHMGVDQDYQSLLLSAARCSLADGWGGSMISTDLQDVLFGNPVPVLGQINLGVLKKDQINVVVHGHEPLLPEVLVSVVKDPEIQKAALATGAKGINLVGMCCSANELLMRHGIPVAGNFLQQELAIVTGVVDLMAVDVQCEMQSLAQVAKCYHTKLITTSPKAKIEGAMHIEFDERHASEAARKILMEAVGNFKNRKANVEIPDDTTDQVVGFSYETINYLLGGMFRASYRPLNDNIINGRIRGIAGVVGCNNARVTHDDPNLTLIKELIKNDVIVLVTGCAAMTCGKAGLLTPDAARKYAGEGLASVCEAVGIPPVLHMGSCVDNSRILLAATAVVKAGGLGEDISDLPVAGAALEWMSEKAIAIGEYFVASGIYTVFGVTWPTTGSEEVTKLLFEDYENLFKGKWGFEPDPLKAAKSMIDHIDKKRKALGIDKMRERVLFDMAKRREIEAA